MVSVRRQTTPFCLRESSERSNLLIDVTLGYDKMYSVDVDSFFFIKIPLCKTVDFVCDFISLHNTRLPVRVGHIEHVAVFLYTGNIRFSFAGVKHFN